MSLGNSRKEEELIKQEARELCREDLHYLAKNVLGYDRITDHCHYTMSKDVDTPNYRFKLLLWPRGHFKSTIGTESRSIQKILRNPNERILITNAKLDNSRKFLRTILQHYHQNSTFRWLWRDWWMKNYTTEHHKEQFGEKLDWVLRDTQDEFIALRPSQAREATITTGAVDASLVSQHYSTIIADDLINREYVRTVDMVEKSILYFKDLLDLLDPDGELEVIGTRWSHVDLYSWIIEEFGGTASLRVPDNYLPEDVVEQSKETPEEDKEWMISIQPARQADGTPIFPEEFNDKVLKDLLKAKGPYEYGAQYDLNPTPAEHQKFKPEWFRIVRELPDPSSLNVCITVDPAKSIEDNADNTAIAVYGYDYYNNMYLLDGRDEQLAIDELPEALFDLVVKWKGMAKFLYPVGFEAVGFQETYVYTLERMMKERKFFFMVEPIKSRKNSKEERILGLVPRIKNGFYVPKSLFITPYNGGEPYDLVQRLKWQLLKFPFTGDRDDFADATADQLMLVQAGSLPTEKPPEPEPDKREIKHRSLMEDKRRKALRRARSSKSFGAVR